MRKKLILLFLVLCFLMLINVYGGKRIDGADGKTILYSKSYSSLFEEEEDFTFYYTGESIELETEQDANELIDRYSAKMIFTEQTDNGESFYYYTEKLPIYKYINGKRVNLHIHVGKKITVGYPIIFGSY